MWKTPWRAIICPNIHMSKHRTLHIDSFWLMTVILCVHCESHKLCILGFAATCLGKSCLIFACVRELVPWDSRHPAMKSYRLSAWFLCPFPWWRGRCTRGCYRSSRGSLERGEHLRVPARRLHTPLGQRMRKSGSQSQLFYWIKLKQSEYLDWHVKTCDKSLFNSASCADDKNNSSHK